jgi:hypothetical protein
VIDCTNPPTPDFTALAIGDTTSGAEQVAAWAPRSRYRFRLRTSERARVTVEYLRYRIDENRRGDDSKEMQHYEVVEDPDSDRSAASSRTT